MTGLVVDSGVVIKWFLPEPYSTEARRVLDDYRTRTVHFLAPDLIQLDRPHGWLTQDHIQSGDAESGVKSAAPAPRHQPKEPTPVKPGPTRPIGTEMTSPGTTKELLDRKRNFAAHKVALVHNRSDLKARKRAFG